MKTKTIGFIICLSFIMLYFINLGIQEKNKVNLAKSEQIAILKWLTSDISENDIISIKSSEIENLLTQLDKSEMIKIFSSLQPFNGLGHINKQKEFVVNLNKYYGNGNLSLIIASNNDEKAIYFAYSLSKKKTQKW